MNHLVRMFKIEKNHLEVIDRFRNYSNLSIFFENENKLTPLELE